MGRYIYFMSFDFYSTDIVKLQINKKICRIYSRINEDLLLLKEFFTFVDELIEILIYSQLKVYPNHFHSVTFSPCDSKITGWNKSLLNHTLMHTSPNNSSQLSQINHTTNYTQWCTVSHKSLQITRVLINNARIQRIQS